MSTPSPNPEQSAAPPRSARDNVAEALRSWLAQGETWPPADAARVRNLLLDSCGSDHRPLVELLLRVGRHGVADTLSPLGALAPAEWTARRASLVARTTGALFIDADLAAWAVDTWAVALGVITPQALAQQRVVHASSVVRDAPTAIPRAPTGGARGAAAQRATTPSYAPRTPRPAPLPGAPSWAGGSQSTRIGAVQSATGMRVIAGWQGSNTPVHVPNVRRQITVLTIVMAIALVVVIKAPRGADGVGRSVLSRNADAAPTAAAVADSVSQRTPPLSDTISRTAAVAAGAQMSSDTSSRAAAAAGRSPQSTERLPRDTQSAESRAMAAQFGGATFDVALQPTAEETSALDTIRLVDGRQLVGSIRLVAPTALFVHDVRTGLEYTMPFAQIASVITRTGAVLELPESPPDNPVPTATALLARGVGGEYRVEQRVQSVDGGAMCSPVASALGREVIRSVEEFTHEPGSREFALASRPGVRGVIDGGARFTSVPYRSERDGVRFVFRMSGYFTPGGFVARTVTETEAIIRYRRTQNCRIVADLLGTRTGSARREPAPPLPR